MTGCNNFWIHPELEQGHAGRSSTGSTQALSKTGVGAATGAALGAGLGAIVGSTTGSAGGGLVIGAAAGATAGGLIGRELQNQDDEYVAQRESLTRQEEIIRQQRRDLQGLRGEASDSAMNESTPTGFLAPARSSSSFQADSRVATLPSSTGSSDIAFQYNKPSQYSGQYSPERYRGNPRAQVFGGAREARGMLAAGAVQPSAAPSRTQVAPRRIEPEVRREEPAILAVSEPRHEEPPVKTPSGLPVAKKADTPKIAPIAAVVSKPTPKPEAPAISPIVAPLTPPPAKLETPESDVTAKISTPPAVESPVVPEPVVEKVAEKGSAAVEPTQVAKNAPETSSEEADCDRTQAEQEATRARSASSAADKLFYFRRALRLCPMDSNYHLEVGRVYTGIGRAEDAAYEFRQAIDLNEKNEEARNALRQLEVEHGPLGG